MQSSGSVVFSEQSSDEEDTGETSPRIESKETLPVNALSETSPLKKEPFNPLPVITTIAPRLTSTISGPEGAVTTSKLETRSVVVGDDEVLKAPTGDVGQKPVLRYLGNTTVGGLGDGLGNGLTPKFVSSVTSDGLGTKIVGGGLINVLSSGLQQTSVDGGLGQTSVGGGLGQMSVGGGLRQTSVGGGLVQMSVGGVGLLGVSAGGVDLTGGLGEMPTASGGGLTVTSVGSGGGLSGGIKLMSSSDSGLSVGVREASVASGGLTGGHRVTSVGSGQGGGLSGGLSGGQGGGLSGGQGGGQGGGLGGGLGGGPGGGQGGSLNGGQGGGLSGGLSGDLGVGLSGGLGGGLSGGLGVGQGGGLGVGLSGGLGGGLSGGQGGGKALLGSRLGGGLGQSSVGDGRGQTSIGGGVGQTSVGGGLGQKSIGLGQTFIGDGLGSATVGSGLGRASVGGDLGPMSLTSGLGQSHDLDVWALRLRQSRIMAANIMTHSKMNRPNPQHTHILRRKGLFSRRELVASVKGILSRYRADLLEIDYELINSDCCAQIKADLRRDPNEAATTLLEYLETKDSPDDLLKFCKFLREEAQQDVIGGPLLIKLAKQIEGALALTTSRPSSQP